MPRSMKQTPVISFGAAVVTTILTCPPLHKLEVINGRAQATALADVLGGFLHQPAGGALMWVSLSSAPPSGVFDWKGGTIVLFPGDKLVAYTSSGVMSCFATYIDVDLTPQ